MPKPNAKKRRVNRVKGFASRGLTRRWKWILLLLVLLLIPAMQVAAVRLTLSLPLNRLRIAETGYRKVFTQKVAT